MNTNDSWMADLAGTWGEQLQSAAQHLPGIVGALVVLIVGYLLARLVRRAIRSLADASNRFLSRQLSVGPLAAVRLSPTMITLLAEILFWVVLVIAATLALRIAGFGLIAQWFDRIAIYLPNLVAAFVILAVGLPFSVFVRERLNPQTDTPGVVNRWAWIARAVQALIIVVLILVALDQLGINVGLLIALAVVGAAGVTLTLGATIAMGARQHAANLIGIRSARSNLHVGQWLRVADIEGQIVEFSETQIVLDTDEGRVLLPGHYMDDKVATILMRDAQGENSNG